MGEIVLTGEKADNLSLALKQLGFTFVGFHEYTNFDIPDNNDTRLHLTFKIARVELTVHRDTHLRDGILHKSSTNSKSVKSFEKRLIKQLNQIIVRKEAGLGRGK